MIKWEYFTVLVNNMITSKSFKFHLDKIIKHENMKIRQIAYCAALYLGSLQIEIWLHFESILHTKTVYHTHYRDELYNSTCTQQNLQTDDFRSDEIHLTKLRNDEQFSERRGLTSLIFPTFSTTKTISNPDFHLKLSRKLKKFQNALWNVCKIHYMYFMLL